MAKIKGIFHAGIDEAGYGPLLGPLVVASASVSGRTAEEDFWKRFKAARSGSRGSFVIGDSKKIYSPGRGIQKLETSVLAFITAGANGIPRTLEELLGMTAVSSRPSGRGGPPTIGRPWDSVSVELPLSVPAPAVEQTRDRIASSGVAPDVRIEVVTPGDFNRGLALLANKSLLLFEKVEVLVKAAIARRDGAPASIVCDRLGGRKRYGALLAGTFGQHSIRVVSESAAGSNYILANPPGTARRIPETKLSFIPRADDRYFLVGLASMAAKYVRELFMHRLNKYFQTMDPGLKKTAGYYEDGMRFLADVEHIRSRHAIPLEELRRFG